MDLQVPDDVIAFVRAAFGRCNQQLANDLSTFPAIHEESLDMNFISNFARHQAPVRLPSNWIVRIDAHFIGGGRHFGTWEVADIGLMMVFRKKGKVIKSKICMLQSKKLYASPLAVVPEDPHFRRAGLGRLLVSESEHASIIEDKLLAFKKTSRYQAFRKGSDQQETMGHFERRWGTELYYLFYNPLLIPLSVQMPLQNWPELPTNDIGCRVVLKRNLDQVLAARADGYSPTFSDLEKGLGSECQGVPSVGGWRLEDFAADLMLKCKAGLVDESQNFESLAILMNQKQRPMSCALSITFDIRE